MRQRRIERRRAQRTAREDLPAERSEEGRAARIEAARVAESILGERERGREEERREASRDSSKISKSAGPAKELGGTRLYSSSASSHRQLFLYCIRSRHFLNESRLSSRRRESSQNEEGLRRPLPAAQAAEVAKTAEREGQLGISIVCETRQSFVAHVYGLQRVTRSLSSQPRDRGPTLR